MAFCTWLLMLIAGVSPAIAINLQLKYRHHPYLYFTEENIPELQRMAKTTHLHIAQELEEAAKTMMAKRDAYLPPRDYAKFGGRWNELYGNNLAPLALYCVLNPHDVDAFVFTLEYMDIMASHRKWQVISVPHDEVPVAHSLTGFITAFDFLYPHLNVERRRHYTARIFNETKDFVRYTKSRAWGRFYLQNHVATNYLAFFHGCLVTALHVPRTMVWLEEAVLALERNFKLLNHIVDGSLDEGVAYGSYTSRSFLQYAFLSLRHFGIDHTSDTWLQNHFQFYYNTLLPKFQRTVGIADSNHNWFYGPESQLVFLDAYVLQNGNGNWLASQIRKFRNDTKETPLRASLSQRWCTLHTEFLWYDPLIEPTIPASDNGKDLHTFTDWGVVTYNDQIGNPNGTFLAFKSGALHGRAVFDVVQRAMYPWLRGWSSFNPGHEHPDQNMFVFVPNGRLFVTDALYGPKLTYLNNVLSFTPSPTSKCNEPWEGQLGECNKWLDWHDVKTGTSRGDIIYSEENQGIVFIGGEAVKAYDPSMKLVSVYRSLVLLESELLLVVDHVETETSSKITHSSAFFHNLEYIFSQDSLNQRLNGAKLTIEGKRYRILWITSLDRSPRASIAKESHPSEYQKRQTHFVNVTVKLTPTITRVAYVFVGPSVDIQEVQFMDNDKKGCHVLVRTSEEYSIHISTRHQDLSSRQSYLGYPGFATVKTTGKEARFGSSSRQVHHTEYYPDEQKCYDLIAVCIVVTVALCVVVCLTITKLRICARAQTRVILGLLLLVAFAHTSVYLVQCPQMSCESCTSSSPFKTVNPVSPSVVEKPEFPSVIVTSLPGSAAELGGWIFFQNPDVAVLPVPSSHVSHPKLDSIDNLLTDVCSWEDARAGNLLDLGRWMSDLPTEMADLFENLEVQESYEDIFFGRDLQPPPLNMQNHSSSERKRFDVPIYKNYTLRSLQKHVSSHPAALPVLFFGTGSWALKVNFFAEVFQSRLRHIHFVRNPLSWISNFLRNERELYVSLMVERVLRQFLESSGQLCAPNGKILPEFLAIRRSLEESERKEPHLLLALVWKAHTEAILRLGSDLWESSLKVVKLEDLLAAADNVTREIYDFIGLPARPVSINQALQVTRSNVYHIPYEGTIGSHSTDSWREVLSQDQVRDILQICGSVMVQLGYR